MQCKLRQYKKPPVVEMASEVREVEERGMIDLEKFGKTIVGVIIAVARVWEL